MTASTEPVISVIVIGFDMPGQLLNTVYTLSQAFQRDVAAHEFEILVVENASTNNADGAAIEALGDNIHYFLRQEPGVSPVPAVNFAFQQCRGQFVGLIVDGARMVSPGVLRCALDIYRGNNDAVLVVPGYHLGFVEQHDIEDPREALAEEQRLLASVPWRENGYRLFQISTFSGANIRGYLQPIMECNCLFASKQNFAAVGYADPAFCLPGGGAINLHLYRSIAMLPHTQLMLTPGEGSFHQFHGGVTTSSYEERSAQVKSIKEQLDSFWQPGGFKAVSREPCLYGSVAPEAQPFLQQSLQFCRQRTERLRANDKPLWADDDIIASRQQ